MPATRTTSTDDLVRRFCETRTLTEVLAAPLGPEDQTVQSMPDVSPTKWHRAHVTWFFEEFVLGHDGDRPPHHRAYRYLFNSYYEAVGERHPRAERGLLARPTVREVTEYRRAVDDAVLEHLAREERREVLDLVELGIHHEQQHQELLLMDAKHVLSQGPLDPVYRAPSCPGRLRSTDGSGPRPSAPVDVAGPGFTEHDAGLVVIGHDGDGFAYDNEGPQHQVWLEPFAIADRTVTAGEWQAFIDDGGYERSDLWLSEGWATAQAEGWECPLYWRRDGEAWSVFTLAGRRRVDPHEPVCHVSYFEADAYARWARARLPTEAEWEVAAQTRPASEDHCLDLDALHPRAGDTPGPGGFTGGVWEWTASPYVAYPGFVPAAGAVGEYNGKFMVNQQVLRGGSCVTPRGHIRPTYRNFFPTSARWMFGGVRLARGADA